MVATTLLWLLLAAAPAPTDEQVAGLIEQVRGMHIVLMRLDRVDGPDARPLMAQHWRETQRYMAALLDVTPPASPRAGEPDCRVGGLWTPLALPDDVDIYLYRAVMQALDRRMRLELAQIRAATTTHERRARLQAHWNSTYQDFQALRGLGWMFGRWMPLERDGRVLPEPESAGAQQVARHCTQCHATPPPSLHTAREWAALMTTMTRHMARSDTAVPICVTPLPPADVPGVLEYLQRHAR